MPAVHRVPPRAADDYDKAHGGTPALKGLTRGHARQIGFPTRVRSYIVQSRLRIVPTYRVHT